MNEFVEECRGEWKRLGVPDPVADEMAADLAVDLAEAEAEGVSREEVLGSAAFDPRSFAAAWAAERGLVRRVASTRRGLLRKSLSVALAAFALLAVVGAVVVIVAPRSDSGRLAFGTPFQARVAANARLEASLAGARLEASAARLRALRVRPPDSRTVVVVPSDLSPGGVRVAPGDNDSGVDTRTVGWILLAVGLAGVVPLAISLPWLGGGPHGRTPTFG